MLRQLGPDNLSFQYDQLLTQKHVLGDQLPLASPQIRHRAHDLIPLGRPGPSLEARLDPGHTSDHGLGQPATQCFVIQWVFDLVG